MSSHLISLPQTQSQADAVTLYHDRLVISVGSYAQTFGVPGVKENAIFLRDVSDARKIRMTIISRFEEAASLKITDEERQNLLHFAIVGGGPTGCEFAAELHGAFKHQGVVMFPRASADMPDVSRSRAKRHPALLPRPGEVRVNITIRRSVNLITYIDAAFIITDPRLIFPDADVVSEKILAAFDEDLQKYAKARFQREGITVKNSHHVERVEPVGPCARTQEIRQEMTRHCTSRAS